MEQRPRQKWLARVVRDSFGFSFWMFVAAAVIMAVICYLVLGPVAFDEAISSDRQLLADMLPRVAAAQVVAGLIWVMLPRDRVSRLLGNENDHRGLFIATLVGVITPGGPASAYPLLAIIAVAGADRGILVAYITSWALLGMQRIIVWDVPFMGLDFSILRFLVCLPLPIIAGMIARRLPISLVLVENADDKQAGR